ncbi:ribonuclease J [Williamsia sp. Leaf354]|uniref:ribonuclease J n=1 Tax=Williamsia sp. Leaf354 TaxID=1736349 RepID=UPI0009E71101|nr:RNase J family beta-CASP ribonuclease [Williamsia sp. Leaf354]
MTETPNAGRRPRRAATRRSGPPEPTPEVTETPQPVAESAPADAPAEPQSSSSAPAPAEQQSAPSRSRRQKSASAKAAPEKSAPEKSSGKSAPAKGSGDRAPARSSRSDNRKGGGNRRSEPGRDRSPRAASQPVGDATDRLGLPNKLPRGGLRVVALGGIGEIGRNMTVFEFDGKLLIVDCGVQFPDSEPGINLSIPDFSYIADRLDQVEAVLLTHGHEDHIGALPYLLRLRADIPIYGSRFTLALLRAKCQEHRQTPRLVVVDKKTENIHGPFKSEFISVTHSIPHSFAVAIQYPGGKIFHSGDLKIDPTPLDGRKTDLNRMASFAGESGVDLVLMDSTNAEIPGFVSSEAEIGQNLREVIKSADGRILVVAFASNIHRVQSVLDAALETGRKVCFLGRSMVRNTEIAANEGYLSYAASDVVNISEYQNLSPTKTVLVCTGSQGEPLAALTRISRGEHRQLSIDPGDLVIFSSSIVPGNEKAVTSVVNRLVRRGAQVVSQSNRKVHVTGHAAVGELKYLYNILRPKNVMPVHGEWKHLVANHGIAVAAGTTASQVLVAEDGVVVDLLQGVARFAGRIPLKSVYLDGNRLDDITNQILEERGRLADGGAVAIAIYYDSDQAVIVGEPRIKSVGLTSADSFSSHLLTAIRKDFEKSLLGQQTKLSDLSRIVTNSASRWIKSNYDRAPVVIPVLIDLSHAQTARCESD